MIRIQYNKVTDTHQVEEHCSCERLKRGPSMCLVVKLDQVLKEHRNSITSMFGDGMKVTGGWVCTFCV